MPEASTKLRFGPYSLPRAVLGDTIRCEYRKRDVVADCITDAPIPWYKSGRGSRAPLIVYGDLVRAIQQESAAAVATNWGITDETVTNWRRALGVRRMTPGTTMSFREAFDGRLTNADRARALKNSKTKKAIAKMSASKRGRPMHPATKSALLIVAGKQKSKAHRQALSRAHKKRGTLVPGIKVWTKNEDRLLGKTSDRDLAEKIGRSVNAVRKRRAILGISRHQPE